MAAGSTPSRNDPRRMRRRTFLAGTFGTVCSALTAGTVAGCEAATSHDASRILNIPHSKNTHLNTLRPNTTELNTTQASVDRIAHRPNDGSGVWADFSNTGYQHDPGYSGSGGNCTHGYAGLNDYSPEMTANSLLFVNEPAGHVFNRIHFRGTAMLGVDRGDRWTFNGCVFDNGGEGKGEADFIIQNYLPTVCTWNYCTFKPCDYTVPPGNDGTVSTSHTYPGTPYLSSYQSFNTNANGLQTGRAAVKRHHCDIWGNAGMQDVFNGTAGNHVILDWCYIHDQADTDGSTAKAAGVPYSDLYHQDGVGPDGRNGSHWIDITNCTIASLGNTNGIAFQSTPCHHHLIAGNYLSGFGITVNLGGFGIAKDTNIRFTDNVLSAEVPYIFRPQYWSSAWHSARTGMVWRGNRFQFFHGDPTMTAIFRGGPTPKLNGMDSSWRGKYWWPTDSGTAAHHRDYTG